MFIILFHLFLMGLERGLNYAIPYDFETSRNEP